MANSDQMTLVRQPGGWNHCRKERPDLASDLTEADLREADPGGAKLSLRSGRAVLKGKKSQQTRYPSRFQFSGYPLSFKNR